MSGSLVKSESDLLVDIEVKTGIKQASACLRAGAIKVSVPRHWPKHNKESAIETLVGKIKKQHTNDLNVVHQFNNAELITIDDKVALKDYVFNLNENTLRVPLEGIRMGSSKYSRLAQMNTKTHVMTVSKYCLTQVPQRALDYLILHELAHLIEANHSKRFWALVAQFMPDYKTQSKVIKAFHQIRCQEADLKANTARPLTPSPSTSKPYPDQTPDLKEPDPAHPWFEDFKQLFLLKPH